ncbi:MAG TPA: branched-chain amino acid ABC transporter substrate-binding protein [bacterium]|nr:branched-chain amino acid ABC transporter substrate-binding protein [bacterium]
MRKRNLFGSLALCALLGTVAFTAPVPAATVGPVTDPIGVVQIGPGQPVVIATWLVTSGPNSALGTDSQRGIEIAIDDQGGKLLGHPIKLEANDDGCSAEGGQTAAQKVAADPSVVAAIGGSCSSATVPGVPILWKAGIVDVSPSATAPPLTAPDRSADFAGFLRTAHNDKVQGQVAATFARQVLKKMRAATIHDGSPYAQGLVNAFADNFKKMGGTITSQEAISVGDTDMKPVLTRIATGKPDMIFYPIFVAEGGLITRQTKEISGLQTVTLFGADGLFTPDFLKAAGDAAKGMYWSSPDLTPQTLGPAYASVFVPKYQKKYGERPTAAFHPHAYDAANIIFAAIKKVGKDQGGTLYIGRKALRDALFATKGFKGLTGTITCNPYGDCADPHIAIYQAVSSDPSKFSPGTDPKKVYPTK